MLSKQQQVITLEVRVEDIHAALYAPWCDTTADPIAQAMYRTFSLPPRSVSVGLDDICVFEGDASLDVLAAVYVLDDVGRKFVAAWDTARRGSKPAAITARLDLNDSRVRKGVESGSAVYDLIEDAEDVPPDKIPDKIPAPIIIGAEPEAPYAAAV